MNKQHYPPLSLKGRGTGPQGQGEGYPIRGKTPDHLLERSRRMRRERTEAEDRMWYRLRDRRLSGYKFRNQAPMGPDYIVDFICPSAKLIVELDGSQHAEQSAYDNQRTRFLEGEGCRVIRFWNDDALARTEVVLEAILAALKTPHPAASRLSLSPSGRGRAEEA